MKRRRTPARAGISNTDIRITDEGGANTAGVTVSGNYLIGAGFAFEVGMANTNPMSNVSFTNNYIGFNLYGQYYTGHDQLRDRDRDDGRRLLKSDRIE